MSGRHMITATITLALVAVAVAALLSSGPNTGSDRTKVSALNGPISRDDRLPRSVLDSPSSKVFANPLYSVHATSAKGGDYYVVKGTDDQLCLEGVVEIRGAPATETTCGPVRRVENGGAIWNAAIDDVAGKLRITGIVADGYERARLGAVTAPVTRNVFVLTSKLPEGSGAALQLSGSSVPTRTVDIGPTAPAPVRVNTGTP